MRQLDVHHDFGESLLLVFLIFALILMALYESWSLSVAAREAAESVNANDTSAGREAARTRAGRGQRLN
ncbi:MAG: hypothetical protein ABSC63_17395 [Candidatus Binataceae bacterium]